MTKKRKVEVARLINNQLSFIELNLDIDNKFVRFMMDNLLRDLRELRKY